MSMRPCAGGGDGVGRGAVVVVVAVDDVGAEIMEVDHVDVEVGEAFLGCERERERERRDVV